MLDVVGDAEAVRTGRRFVEREVIALGLTAVADDVTLAAAELLANALQHGHPPVSVAVSGDAHRVRLEVRDGNSRPPVRPAPSTTNMTGRGMALIEALASRWGAEPEDGGKVVWAEFEATRPTTGEAGREEDVDALLAAWADHETGGDEQRYTVVLGDVPTDLLIEAKAHIDNLVREFSLAARAADVGEAVPEHLAELIRTVVYGFAEARDAIKRQALAAARRGEVRTQLTLHLPARATVAAEAYLAALDEADAYARAARLLTLETPAAHRLFRCWYVEAVVHQLRELSAGRRPPPVESFEATMLQEIQRLATLQRVTDRAARLQRVTAALAGARTSEDVADVVVSEGVAALDAAGGGLLVPAEDGVHVAVPGAVGYGEALVGALRDERLDAPLPAATALRTGEAVWLESRAERDQRFPALHGFESSTVSMCAVPLVAGGRTLGALRFSFGTRRLFDDDERNFVLALAAQTAQTLLRTESYAAERQASLNLQRALLPERIPPLAGWEAAAHYSPAGGQHAGGDFYDVLALGDGRALAVVGDVMGRGVEAAAAMAQIRTMIRAYAVEDPHPAAVLSRVDGYFRTTDVTQFATALCVLVDLATGEMVVGNAGHLAPIVVDADGGRVVDLPTGTPLGVDHRAARESGSLVLPPGAALVIVTDGLVERRGEDIDEGVSRVVAAASGAVSGADQLLDRVLATASDTRPADDDVTALVLCRR